MLTAAAMQWFVGHYLQTEANPREVLASPIYAENLSGLPPALVITAEFDPLRDEGEAYARRLQEAGVPTRLSRYDGVIHGFFAMTAVLDAGRAAVAEAAEALNMAFSP